MARKPRKEEPNPKPKKAPGLKPKTTKPIDESGRVTATAVPLPSRKFVLIEDGHGVWFFDEPEAMGDVKDAIVRLRPDVDIPAERIALVKGWAEERGAARVKVEVKRRKLVPEAALKKREPTNLGAREVCKQLIEESASTNKDALRAIVFSAFDEVGL